MGVDSIVRTGVATANKLTSSLQPFVTFYGWIGQDVFGKPLYAAGIQYQALVEPGIRRRRLPSGQEVSTKAKVSFFKPMPPTTATVPRTQPIDPRDKVVLSDGTTGPLVDISGPPVDPQTSKPYFYELFIGA